MLRQLLPAGPGRRWQKANARGGERLIYTRSVSGRTNTFTVLVLVVILNDWVGVTVRILSTQSEGSAYQVNHLVVGIYVEVK